MDSWDIITECSYVLPDVQKLYPDIPVPSVGVIKYTNSPEYQTALSWKRYVEPYAKYIKDIHVVLLNDKSRDYSESVCLDDLCDLLTIIDSLRPVTVPKILSPEWRQRFHNELYLRISKLVVNIKNDQIVRTNTYTSLPEIPNFSVSGLPGFCYPKYRCPPLIKLVRPVNTYKPPNVSGNKLQNPGSKLSNVDGISEIFGPWNKIGDTFTSSPMKFSKKIRCSEFNDGILDFGDGPPLEINFPEVPPIEFPVLPNISASVDVVINIDECVSRFLPPMFMPKVKLVSISIGNGTEFGVYANSTLKSSNFGSGF